MRILVVAMTMCLLLLGTRDAGAALSGEAYEQLRQRAPFIFEGTVQNDPGGRATLRVEQVMRGQLSMGQFITVLYPEYRGSVGMPGAATPYERFVPGVRLRIFADPAPDGRSLAIVHQGIDVLTQPRNRPPPKSRGGCAACTAGGGSGQSPAAPLWAALGLVVFALRRLRYSEP